MEPSDEKWVEAKFAEISNDLEEIKESRRRNIQNFQTRLNLLEKQLAVVQAQAKVWATVWGAGSGVIFGIIAEIITKNIL